MEFDNEKGLIVNSSPSAITQSLTRLKLDAERDFFEFRNYAKEFQERSNAVSGSDDNHMLRKFLLFIANAPAKILRQLSSRLRALSRKLRVKIQQGVWRLPRFLVGDVIRFEDALGRRSHLPHQYLEYWPLIKPFLAHIFEGLPGYYQILRGRYRLLHNRTGQFLSESQWTRLVKPGDRITMSMLSRVLSEPSQHLECPACTTLIANQNQSLDQVKCLNCDSIFPLLNATSHPHVTPSDGFYIPLPTPVQRRIEAVSTHNVEYSGEPQDDIDINSSPADEYHNHDKARINLGLSQLKHVLIQPTQSPREVVDVIEDLLDETITASGNTIIATDPHVLRLRAVNEVIREEVQRRGELNYLDFKMEHEKFMQHSRAAIQQLKTSLRDPPNTLTPIDGRRDMLGIYCNWVRDHYSLASNLLGTSSDGGNGIDTDDYADTVLVLMKTLMGSVLCFRLPRTLTVKHLKESYSNRHGAPVNQQYLVYKGRKLEDHLTIGHYGIGPEYYVHVLLPIWRPTSSA